METISSIRRVAKNTLFLYSRMLLMLAINLYTSRVVLQTLGIEDYGLYNVIGGFVAMFTVMSGSLSTAISRFLTYELGKANYEKLKDIFSSSIVIQLIMSFMVMLVAEVFGLFFLGAYMKIPENRLYAALWVYHCSVFSFVIVLICVPYRALIIAHEKMSAFAILSIIESFLKLLIVFALLLFSSDKLIIYALLSLLIVVLIQFCYGAYCVKSFTESRTKMVLNRSILQEMMGFAGWNFLGSSAVVLRDHGGNVLLNMFFGPACNAARGVAMQVNYAVTAFTTNFMTALNPQITKSYAQDNMELTSTLVNKGAKYSFYIVLILAVPIILNTKVLLNLWLVEVPRYSVIFVQLVIIQSLFEVLSNPLKTLVLATGNTRDYQIVVGLIQLMNLPLSYLFLLSGFSPISVFIVSILLSALGLFTRLFMLKRIIGYKVRGFVFSVFLRVVGLFILTLSLAFPVCWFLGNSTLECFAKIFLSFLIPVMMVYYIGCTNSERMYLLSFIQRRDENRNTYIS